MNQKGNITLYVLIAVLVLVLIGAGYYLYTTNKQTTSVNPPSAQNPTSSPTNTQTTFPNPSNNAVSVASSSHPVIAVMANGASSFPLRSGDFVIGSAGQQVGGTTSQQGFQPAISSLEKVTTPGVNKILGFSSINDLNADISSIPADINYIDYSTEQGTTPQAELNSLTSSVTQFASIVHSHGKKVVWAPQHKYFDSMQSAGTLASILTSVDMIQYQGQRLLTTESNFISDMQGKYSSAKTANPKIIFYLQLWVGTNGSTSEQIITGFNNLVGFYDIAGFGGGSSTDIQTVIEGLNFRK